MRYQVKSYLLFITLFVLKNNVIAQSVLSDTIIFNYFSLNSNGELRSREDINSNINDTIRNIRSIFIDNSDIVHWKETKLSYLDSDNLNEMSFHENLLNLTFKVRKKIDGFYYQSQSDSQRILFKASFNKNDTIHTTPFFCYLRYFYVSPEYDYGMYYKKDSTIIFNGNIVPCYVFAKQGGDFFNDKESFYMVYIEIFFEKKSCIPIFLTLKNCMRMPGYSDENGKVNFVLGYSTHIIYPIDKRR